MSDVDKLKIQARRAEARGDYGRAARLYLRAISTAEADDALTDAGLLVRVGDLEHRQDDHEGALAYYLRAVDLYADQGLVTNAVAVCNKILRLFPDHHECHARLAHLHLEMGITADARSHIFAFDEAAAGADGPEAAVEALRSYLDREPDQEVALRLADRLEEAGRADEALATLEEVWRRRTLEELEAEALQNRARELDPDVDLEAWEQPPAEVEAGDGEEEAAGEAAPAAEGKRAGLGNLGVLEELEAEADAAREESVHIGVLQTLARLVEFRDLEAERHAARVGELAARLARAVGLSGEESELVRNAAPLHDIGMVVVPDRVLLKEDELTPEERKIMITHAANGARILSESDLPVMRLASEIAHTHHERWDGGGYPRGLEGDAIPLSGRVVAVADAFRAMTRDRPFREAESAEEALEEIRGSRGTQFDPRVVDALLEVMEDPGAG